MPRTKEHNEQEALKLDEHFKETLARVRPYILELTSPECAELCKVWLNKLSAAISQRRLRNEYLVEFCRQLKTGRVGGIFRRPPPNGLLLPLPKSYHSVCISSSLSDVSDNIARRHQTCLKSNLKTVQHAQRSRTPLKRTTVDSSSASPCCRTMNASPIVRFQNQNASGKNQALHKQRADFLHLQRGYEKDQLEERRENNNDDKRLFANIGHLTAEVSALKSKLLHVEKAKGIPGESHQELVEYQRAVVEQLTDLKQQLYEAQVRNEMLDNNLATMAEKLEQVVHGKDAEIKAMERQWMDKLKMLYQRYDTFADEKNQEFRLKEELVGKKDSERKQEMEVLTNKILDLEAKLEAKIKDEDKLQIMLVEQFTAIKEEFSKMRSEIDLASQKQNHNLSSKITTLKRLVEKLEKSKARLEQDYEKKIAYIVKNKDTEIKVLHMKLQEQRNDLYTMLSTKKQSEVDRIATMLEDRYRTLLAEAEVSAECQNQEYLRKIAILEDQMKSSFDKHSEHISCSQL